MTTYPNSNYKNQYGMLHVHSERIIKQAIADAGLLSEDPDQKIIILKEAHIALTEEMTKLGEELSRIAGRLMRQHLRKIVSEKDIKNALKVYKRKRNQTWSGCTTQRGRATRTRYSEMA